ncbi:MAG: hypothetical protein Q8916_07435 [Bacteroidota bacterium]|nr:hypothetical protein [Bacteroidota bacterium]MDP4230224.1 hypothetical protein [Bacteroidota bacterium]MDP4237404.1 hypothetical protein [Bacteroidota bacterium]
MVRRVLLLAAFFALAIGLYRNGLHIPYYDDDYQEVFTTPHETLTHAFVISNPFNHFYRPFETAILSAIQFHWNWDTFPLRLVHLLLHAAGVLLVFHMLRTWKVSLVASAIASVFMLASQMSVYAMASNNTVSQLLGAFFSALSIWMLYRYLSVATESRSRWNMMVSLLFFFLALLSKETSASLLLSLPLLAFVFQDRKKSFAGRLKKVVIFSLPYFVLFVIYWCLRANSGASVPDANGPITAYHFDLGSNVVRNVGLFIGQTFLPLSTVTVLRYFYLHDIAAIILAVVFTLLFATILLYGLWKSPRRNFAMVIFCFIFFSWLPMIFITHITECYMYNSVILVSVLFGIAAEYYWRLASERRSFLSIGALSIFSVVVVTNALGTDEKCSDMAEQGRRAEILFPQIVSAAKKMPAGCSMILTNLKDAQFSQSRYLMPCFNVLNHSDSLVHYYSGRADIILSRGDLEDLTLLPPGRSGIVFGCDPKTLRVQPVASRPDSLLHLFSER